MKKITIVLLVVFSMFLLTSCNKKEEISIKEEEFIGNWILNNDSKGAFRLLKDNTWKFYKKDGTLISNGSMKTSTSFIELYNYNSTLVAKVTKVNDNLEFELFEELKETFGSKVTAIKDTNITIDEAEQLAIEKYGSKNKKNYDYSYTYAAKVISKNNTEYYVFRRSLHKKNKTSFVDNIFISLDGKDTFNNKKDIIYEDNDVVEVED